MTPTRCSTSSAKAKERSEGGTKERVMIVKVMIGFAVLLSTILVLAASKPKTFRIQRSVSIDAPPEKVFTLIDNLGTWRRWAPQDREDPSMKRTYSGPANGKGAVSEGLVLGARARDAC